MKFVLTTVDNVTRQLPTNNVILKPLFYHSYCVSAKRTISSYHSHGYLYIRKSLDVNSEWARVVKRAPFTNDEYYHSSAIRIIDRVDRYYINWENPPVWLDIKLFKLLVKALRNWDLINPNAKRMAGYHIKHISDVNTFISKNI